MCTDEEHQVDAAQFLIASPTVMVCNLLQSTETTSVCGWKGTAHYYSLQVIALAPVLVQYLFEALGGRGRGGGREGKREREREPTLEHARMLVRVNALCEAVHH